MILNPSYRIINELITYVYMYIVLQISMLDLRAT